MKIENLINRVRQLGTMVPRENTIGLRPLGAQEDYYRDSSGVLREFPVRIKQGPSDLALFRESFIKGRIHDWQVCGMDSLLNEAENANNYLVCSLEEGGIEYFVNVYLIASCWTNTSDHLAIDLNPERFGWIINVWYNPNLAEGDYPVVAHSFTEWLERRLDAGPGKCYYWASPDFVDMGPAIPGDPHYKPRNPL